MYLIKNSRQWSDVTNNSNNSNKYNSSNSNCNNRPSYAALSQQPVFTHRSLQQPHAIASPRKASILHNLLQIPTINRLYEQSHSKLKMLLLLPL
jgi:hypothetical protein